MRRAIAVVVGSGLLLGGAVPVAGAALGEPVPAAPATRTVTYAGYQVTVPAAWPVYRLDTDPGRCVRYDTRAVYLGTPGPDQQCPAGLIGRTETVSIIPGPAGATASAGVLRPAVPGRAAPEKARPDAAQHEIQVAVGGATVVATYGDDPALVSHVLATLRPAPSGATATSATGTAGAPGIPAGQADPLQDGIQPAGTPAAGTHPAGTPAAAGTRAAAGTQAIGARVLAPRAAAGERAPGAAVPVPPPTTAQWHGLPSPWPTAIVEPEPAPVAPARRPLPGFDACTAPSLSTMRAWRRGYAVIGIYIGGVNAACAYGNLSASWITSAASMGWSMLPTYVGPQAPCYGYGTTITPSRAAAQGSAAADDAVRNAAWLHLPKGSPIYYDMEAYSGAPGCTAAVLAFLGAWTRQLNARGYVSGVYSSRDSGIADMQAAAAAKLAGFTRPQAIWIALWDGRGTLDAGSLLWPLTARDKQYLGPRDVTIGGVTLNIDTDLVGGPTAR